MVDCTKSNAETSLIGLDKYDTEGAPCPSI